LKILAPVCYDEILLTALPGVSKKLDSTAWSEQKAFLVSLNPSSSKLLLTSSFWPFDFNGKSTEQGLLTSSLVYFL